MAHFAISGFVGHNGMGKTLRMTEYLAMPAFAKGVPVVANYRLYPERFGYRPDLYVPLRSWRDIVRCGTHWTTLEPADLALWEPQYREAFGYLVGDLAAAGDGVRVTDEGHLEVARLNADGSLYSITGNRGAVLLLDEINAVMPSRGYQSMPPELLRVVNQLRKQDTLVGWTAPAWERADKALREVTSAVHVCRGYLADRWQRDPYHRAWFPRKIKGPDGRALPWAKGWPPRRLFKYSIYDAVEFESASLGLKEGTSVKAKGTHWSWRSKHRAQLAYGSADSVLLLDHIDAFTGTCVTCDGARSRHKCNCGTDHEAIKGATPAAAKRRGGAPSPRPDPGPSTPAVLSVIFEDGA